MYKLFYFLVRRAILRILDHIYAFFFLKKIDVKNMNPRLGSACHLIVYAFMQQCDDVKTIYQKPT